MTALVLFVVLRLGVLGVCTWGLVHSRSEGMSLLFLFAALFFVVDTFRVLVEVRRGRR